MTITRVAAVAGAFGRDMEAAFDTIAALIADARADGVQLLVLPEAALGGYLADLSGGPSGEQEGLPPALQLQGPEIARLIELAGDMVVCAGFCEADPLGGEQRFNAAVAVSGGRILGSYRKVHQPLREDASYSAGAAFPVFDSPIGRMGMLICYDKAFPEAARSLAVQGAEVIACLSAWPASRTDSAPDLADDRWTKRFDLFDQARALENQVVWVSANQAGSFGSLRFVCSAKVCGPGGEVLATTGTQPGVAAADVDIAEALAGARRAMFHLRDRRPELYEPQSSHPALVSS
jgi:predicted amidohydrolase